MDILKQSQQKVGYWFCNGTPHTIQMLYIHVKKRTMDGLNGSKYNGDALLYRRVYNAKFHTETGCSVNLTSYGHDSTPHNYTGVIVAMPL